MNNFEFLIAIFVLIFGSGGALWKIIDTIKTKKERKKLNEILESGLSEIDKKQNDKIDFINEKLEELLIINKVEKNKKKLTKEIKKYTSDFISKKGITNNDLKIVLLNGANLGANIFCEMIDEGLNDVDLATLETEIIGKFKLLRAGISIQKMGVGTDFKGIIRNEVIIPQMQLFLTDFRIFQSSLKNGELLKKFTAISKKMIENIIIQSYNIFKENCK